MYSNPFVENAHSRNTRLQVTPELVDFEQMVANPLEQLQFMDKFGRIRKEIHVEKEKVFYTSATRVDIILNNLFSNAIKYAYLRKEDPYLKVSIRFPDGNAIITVADNGEGISPEAQPKIFDMFYRASGSRTGSGLGLYIVKEAIQKLKGTVSVKSEYGSGTDFVVTIPDMAVRL